MKRPRAARAAPTSFVLNRERFARATREEFGELEGIDAYREGGVAAALSHRFHDALDAGAIGGPSGVEVIVYALEDSVIVAVREEELPFNLPAPLRQLATYSFETKYVFDPENESFEEACAAIEELLAQANALLPSFEALRGGERVFGRRGVRRLLCALRCRAGEPVAPGGWSG